MRLEEHDSTTPEGTTLEVSQGLNGSGNAVYFLESTTDASRKRWPTSPTRQTHVDRFDTLSELLTYAKWAFR